MTAKPVQQEGLVGSLQSEVSAEASPLLQFLIAHAVKIVAGILLFIAAIAAYWLYNSSSDSRRLAESKELGQFMIISDPAVRLEKLAAFAPSAPSSVKTPLAFAMMEAATAVQDQEKVYAAWQLIAESDNIIRPTATVGMASALSKQGKFKEALDVLLQVAPGLTGGDARIVNTRIVFLAEVTGDMGKALAACDSLLALSAGSGDTSIWAQKRADIDAKMKLEATGNTADKAAQPDTPAAPAPADSAKD